MKVLPFNNYSQNSNQKNLNFGAIKSVKFIGLYEKNPQQTDQMVKTLKQNYVLKDFIEKYDVDIIFDACLYAKTKVRNCMSIIFENPTKKKFLGIWGSKSDKIEIERCYDLDNTAKSLTHANYMLIQDIKSGYDGGSGRLTAAIEGKEKEIQKNTININV